MLTTVALLLLLGVSAARADDEIGLSADGSSWTDGLDEPLFDPDVRWVPGDSRTETFFVRNQGPTGAAMTIEARSADRDELLADDEIALRARAAGGTWVPLQNGAASARLTDAVIERGGVVRVDVNATFDPASSNQSQVKRLALDFRVVLADAVGTDGEGDADADGGGGGDIDVDSDSDGGAGADAGSSGGEATGALPDTGASTSRWILLLGTASVVAGAIALRRRDDTKEHA
jgi:LPXTG-motif cell wall-anchored protein